jgi:flavin reductase (DIM6/NTAB) family NADH-FMN oxidoreductase RutF
MAFTTKDFKIACHYRAMSVAIVTASRPNFKATVVTEHSAAFPLDDQDECYVTLVVPTHSATLQAIKTSQFFALNYLRRSQLWMAEATYKLLKAKDKIQWFTRHNIPYLPSANAAVFCSYYRELNLGLNTLVIGHALDARLGNKPTAPLVNHHQDYRSVGGKRVPVTHPRRRRNPRLTE